MTNSIPLSEKKQNDYLLDIQNLVVEYPTDEGNVRAVNDVSLSLQKGEILGLVGESGCGKSTIGFSILGMLKGGIIRDGKIIFAGRDLRKISEEELQRLRGSDISMVFQASQNALNPLQKVSNHFIETLKVHKRWDEKSWNSVKELLQRLEISESRLEDYPFQFSGGMQQRIVIALTFILNPKLIIADEPTTALDVLVQAKLLKLLKELIEEFNLTVIYITHDLGVVAEITHRVAIMYAGKILEIGDTFTIFERSAHPYTQALISAIPNVKAKSKNKMSSIPGHPPDLRDPPKGCCFADRCPFVVPLCREKEPKLILIPSQTNIDHFVRCFKYNDRFSSQFN
ncbi:MAG: ABC transporter ATP-binding protein [Candidatus Hodarchaeota archaeon]